MFALAQGLNNDVNDGNITLYGVWVPVQYTIIYQGDNRNYNMNDAFSYTQAQLNNPATVFPVVDKVDADYFTYQYYFTGWLYNGVKITEATPGEFVAARLADPSYDGVTTTFILTAEWTQKTKVVFDYGDNDPTGYGESYIWVEPNLMDVVLTDYHTQDLTVKDDDITVRYYFTDGWYIDSDCTTAYTKAHNPTGTTELRIYAKWVDKAKVTFSYGDDDLTDPTDTLWVIPGTTGLDIAITDYLSETTAKSKDGVVTAQYYFNGWKIDANGTLDSTATKITAVNGNTVVSVNWDTKHHITYSIGSNVNNPVIKVTINGIEVINCSTKGETNTTGVWAHPEDTVNIHAEATGMIGFFSWNNAHISVTGFNTVSDSSSSIGCTFDNDITPTAKGTTEIKLTRD